MCRGSWLEPRFRVGLCWLVVSTCAVAGEPAAAPAGAASGEWRGVHVFAPSPGGVALTKRAIDEVLAPMGVNALILEVNYKFEYQSHPELRQSPALNKGHARELAECCRKRGIRLIPQFNCLGHQSWSKSIFPLLTQYPELDETPKIPKDNATIYCRSWCPLHPKVNEIVFALIDELIDAFDSEAFHVGMDEVFLIGHYQCPRCRGKRPADLFARAVKDLHRHVVGRRKQTMLIWGDRLIDGMAMWYDPFESSWNRTHPAIDKIPKDVVICDWHYSMRKDYPSVRYFQEKGFRVWPASWRSMKGSLALLECAHRDATERMVGHLCTTWTGSETIARKLLAGPDACKGAGAANQATASLRACMTRLK